jgi:hypothetical protein
LYFQVNMNFLFYFLKLWTFATEKLSKIWTLTLELLKSINSSQIDLIFRPEFSSQEYRIWAEQFLVQRIFHML